MIITARSLERYERLYSGYKRRRSSYKGCSGPRSGTVYEVHLLAHETPVWTRPALHPHSRQRSETARAGRVNEQVYVCPRGPRPKAKRVGPTQSRGDGRLSILNRYSFCRGQKNGITEEQLSDLSRFEDSAHFSNEEKLVLHLAVSLTRTPSDVCDELYGELRKRFSERELVELNAAICWENYRARFTHICYRI